MDDFDRLLKIAKDECRLLGLAVNDNSPPDFSRIDHKLPGFTINDNQLPDVTRSDCRLPEPSTNDNRPPEFSRNKCRLPGLTANDNQPPELANGKISPGILSENMHRNDRENGQVDKQIIVALSTTGSIYHKVIDNPCSDELLDEISFIDELAANHDTQLIKMVCLWANGCIDLPSYRFRKLLCASNHFNKEMKLLLQGADGYIVKTLRQTL